MASSPRSRAAAIHLAPGTLLPAVEERSARARRLGCLESIATEAHRVPDGGIPFVVHLVTRPGRRPAAARRRAGSGPNPFLPYHPDLFVAEVSATHVCLLNRFNVLDTHLLLVTREFEEQESLLTLADFAALAACLEEVDGLGFYNSGPEAGASQRHKHLQLVSFPLGQGPERLPIDPLLAAAGAAGKAGGAGLPFAHAFAPLSGRAGPGPGAPPPEELAARYRQLLAAAFGRRPPGPYNLLATREWILLVPRARAAWEGIEVNALGFAGSLLVASPADLEWVRARGPLAALGHVAGPAPGADH